MIVQTASQCTVLGFFDLVFSTYSKDRCYISKTLDIQIGTMQTPQVGLPSVKTHFCMQ